MKMKTIKLTGIFLMLVTLAIMLGAFTITAFASNESVVNQDENETEEYFEISNADELYQFAQQVNSGNTSINAILTDNITVNANVLKADGTLNGTPSHIWTAIGLSSAIYTGTFNGNDKIISGLYCDGSNNVGLFGCVGEGGKIHNVGVVDSYFRGYSYVGGIVGYNKGTVENCYNTGRVEGGSYVGGLVGYNYDATINNCYNAGVVFSTSNVVGGVAGISTSNDYVTNCFYLSDNASGGIASEDVVGCAEAKSKAQFKSGEVAYLLGEAFGQTVDIKGETPDAFPVFGGAIIYYGYTTCDDSQTNPVYTNDENATLTKPAHTFNAHDFCESCNNAYMPAELVDGVYQIASVGNLYWFAKQVNGGDTSISAILINDITVNEGVLTEMANETPNVSSFKEWTTIGNNFNKYVGTFNGNGKKVGGLYFDNETVGYVALFGCVGEGGKVQNVGVVDSYFRGNMYVSGVVGNNSGEVENCYNESTVLSKNNLVGGVAGYNKGILANCFNDGRVEGGTYVGGALGFNDVGTVENCYNLGYIFGEQNVGGVVGYNNSSNAIVKTCYNLGRVEGGMYVGGVVGSSDGSVKNCYSNGNVNGNNYAGGVIGYSSGTVENCYNLGKVEGNKNLGGVAGNVKNDTTAANCYYLETQEINNGIGGISGADVVGSAEAKSKAQFNSGEVAYLLGEAFGQTVDIKGEIPDAFPVFGGATVYKNQIGGCSDLAYIYEYSNQEKDPISSHIYTANGFCTGCDVYQPAILVEEDNYQSLGISSDYIGYYAISNAGHLYWFALQVNGGNNSMKAILTQNITVNENVLNEDGTLKGTPSLVWEIIGTYGSRYKGIFDGNGHTVSGLYFDNANEYYYVGLFGYVDMDGRVKNIGVIDTYFRGGYQVGGVAGFNSGFITNCFNKGKIEGVVQIGGVVGYNIGEVKNCYNTGKITCTGNYIGGVVGYNPYGNVVNCYNTGDVLGQGNDIGGVVGSNGNIVINCYNTGKVDGDTTVGGVVGHNYDTMTNCFNVGNVKGSTNVGAVIGFNSDKVTNCYYLKTATINNKIGGIKGADVAGKAEAKTELQFTSGEVAYLLNGGVINGTQVFYQNIGTNSYPSFSGNTVYKNQTGGCTDATYTYGYSNEDKEPIVTHSYAYKSEGSTISCACSACGESDGMVTISAQGKTYDGEATSVTITKTGVFEGVEILVTYTKNGLPFTGELIGAGTYVATITYEGVSASVEFVIEKANTSLKVTAPVSYVLPGNNVLLTVNAETEQVSEFYIVAGELYTANGLVVKISPDAVIGQDSITVTVRSAESENYNSAEATISFVVGMPDVSDFEEDMNGADAQLQEKIDKVQTNLDNAKKELDNIIALGDKANADALTEAVANLNKALEDAKAVLETADTTNKSELITQINQAYTSLDSAVKVVQKNLDDLKAELENKNNELANKTVELENNNNKLQTFIIIVCIISGVALCGSGAFVVWFFIDRKKKNNK